MGKPNITEGRRDRNMNNRVKVISIDLGWSTMMKTISQVFVDRCYEITTTPEIIFGG